MVETQINQQIYEGTEKSNLQIESQDKSKKKLIFNLILVIVNIFLLIWLIMNFVYSMEIRAEKAELEQQINEINHKISAVKEGEEN